MNLLEAYAKYIGPFILYISGLPGSKVNSFGKELANDMKIPILYIRDFYNDKSTLDTIKLSNGETINNHYSEKLINYEKLIEVIEKVHKNGVILCGLPIDVKPLAKLSITFHIHLNITKEMYKKGDSIKYDEVIMPYYTKIIKNIRVNKFINIGSMENKEKTYDLIWDTYINFFKKALHQNDE